MLLQLLRHQFLLLAVMPASAQVLALGEALGRGAQGAALQLQPPRLPQGEVERPLLVWKPSTQGQLLRTQGLSQSHTLQAVRELIPGLRTLVHA